MKNLEKYQQTAKDRTTSLEEQISKENQTNASKLANLENFITTIRDSQKTTETNLKHSQGSFEVSNKMQEDVSQLKYSSEKMNYRLEAIKYELDLIKEDIARQKNTQSKYNEKIEMIEKKFDQASLGNHAASKTLASSNFMNNNSTKTLNYDFGREVLEPNFHQPPHEKSEKKERFSQENEVKPIASFGRMESLQKGYMNDEDNDRFSYNRFDFDSNNLSMIEKVGGRKN